MSKEEINKGRNSLKTSSLMKNGRLQFSSDQLKGLPPPPLQKPYPEDANLIDLMNADEFTVGKMAFIDVINKRRSRRKFTKELFTMEELSFLLWTTQGIKRQLHPGTALRTVPSAGCRHALETYLCVLNVEGLDMGIYRYLPVEHQLLLEFHDDHLSKKIVDATLGQVFTGNTAVTFAWTTIPYRMEWRYDIAAHKVIALDAGHVCQNLYLACEAIGAGTCAIAAYHQELVDALLRIDGKDEFAVYLAAVGKV